MNKTSECNSKFNGFIDGEVDIKQIYQALLWGKKWIIGISILAAVISVVYAISLKNIYRSEALIAPTSSGLEDTGGLGGLMSQFGGLASLAGVSYSSREGNKTMIGMEVLKSRAFFAQFVEKRKILPSLIAAKRWHQESSILEYDEALYDEKKKSWTQGIKPGQKQAPSLQEAHETFLSHLYLTQNKNTGLIRVAIEHISPVVARQWVEWLIEDVNEAIRVQDINQSKRSIEFLQKQISQTSLTDLRIGLYELVQSQIENMMLAQASPEYVFKTIDPAVEPEKKVKPKRAFICIAGTLIGSLMGIFSVLVYYFLNDKSKTNMGADHQSGYFKQQ